jgi:hypothetical protein
MGRVLFASDAAPGHTYLDGRRIGIDLSPVRETIPSSSL